MFREHALCYKKTPILRNVRDKAAGVPTASIVAGTEYELITSRGSDCLDSSCPRPPRNPPRWGGAATDGGRAIISEKTEAIWTEWRKRCRLGALYTINGALAAISRQKAVVVPVEHGKPFLATHSFALVVTARCRKTSLNLTITTGVFRAAAPCGLGLLSSSPVPRWR